MADREVVVDGVLHGVLAGSSEESGTVEASKPSDNPETAPGEVHDFDAHNRVGGGGESATDGTGTRQSRDLRV
jgi:hypothetical protein